MIELLLIHFAGPACAERTFFGLPVWYRYLNDGVRMAEVNGTCEFVDGFNIRQDLPLVTLGVLDILIRLAGMVAVGFVIWGGIQLVTSQGDAEGVTRGRKTIINALIGLVVALFATTIVAFVGSRVR